MCRGKWKGQFGFFSCKTPRAKKEGWVVRRNEVLWPGRYENAPSHAEDRFNRFFAWPRFPDLLQHLRRWPATKLLFGGIDLLKPFRKYLRVSAYLARQ